MKIPMTDITKPPIVPAAKGNQKASFPVPTMNGMNPNMVDTTVRKIGIILEFHGQVPTSGNGGVRHCTRS